MELCSVPPQGQSITFTRFLDWMHLNTSEGRKENARQLLESLGPAATDDTFCNYKGEGWRGDRDGIDGLTLSLREAQLLCHLG